MEIQTQEAPVWNSPSHHAGSPSSLQPAPPVGCLWSEILGQILVCDGVRVMGDSESPLWCPHCIAVTGWRMNLFRGVTLYLHHYERCLRFVRSCWICHSALTFNAPADISLSTPRSFLLLFQAEAVKHRLSSSTLKEVLCLVTDTSFAAVFSTATSHFKALLFPQQQKE